MILEIVAAAAAGLCIAVAWWVLTANGHSRLVTQSLKSRNLQSDRRTRSDTTKRGTVFGETTVLDALAFDLELVAICLQAGLPTERALALAAAASNDRAGLDRLGRALTLGKEDIEDPRLASIARLIMFSRQTGVALAPLLNFAGGI